MLQALCGLRIAPRAVGFLRREAAVQASLDPDRLCFVGVLRLIGDAMGDIAIAARELLPLLYAGLLEDIACPPLPERRAFQSASAQAQDEQLGSEAPEHDDVPKLAGLFQETISLS